ncbi:MAG: DUF362 domain-containing protein [Planctomycetota bacterium]|jgi:uncharacterized Fe-S center protein|nr:DUF362 domain-containing protein [Planctomycetota bacterium]
MDRRGFLKTAAVAAAGMMLGKRFSRGLSALGQDAGESKGSGSIPTVYMTRDISPKSLTNIYRRLDREMRGKAAVKISTGEPGGHNYLSPALIKELVQSLNGTIVEANTAYNGKRANTEDHLRAAREHGFLDVAPVDIMDADGEIRLPVGGGTHLKEVRVGSHFSDYDSILVLSHFKGHAMAGFGGALKNIAIGIASRSGKCLVHTAGNSETNPFDGPEKQDDFTESMAEAAEGMIRAMGSENMAYINVMNRLSIDCDCAGNPSEPEIPDIGILASLDPVAVDKAGVDLIYTADEKKGAAFRRRIEAGRGTHILAHAEKLGIGCRRYHLASLDG